MSDLTDSDHSRTTGELCEYVLSASWLSTSLLRFTEPVEPLRALLEVAYAKTGGKRTKKSISKLSLDSLGWNKTHSDAFDGLQDQIKEATRLTHRDPKMVLCLHTDASDQRWASAATQCLPKELSKPLAEQSH